MKIHFHLNYHTTWGESLYLVGSVAALGGGDPEKAIEMTLTGPDMWEVEVDLPATTPEFDYSFVVKAPGQAWRFEWGKPHRFTPGKGVGHYSVFSNWQDLPHDKPFYSSAFTDGIFRRADRSADADLKGGMVRLSVSAPVVKPDEYVVVCGEGDLLGNWDPAKAPRMADAGYPVWQITLPLDRLPVPFEYKFAVFNPATGELRRWEDCPNRIFGIRSTQSTEAIVVEGLRFVAGGHNWKGAGTAIPVFSIRTEEDFGVGDFVSLRKMADWCALTGQNILQVLPVNDTMKTMTWKDSYPYSANSSFALHPMYLRLEEVGVPKNPDKRKYYEDLRRELNALTEIDYERVNNAKQAYLREVFAESGKDTLAGKPFAEFVKKNEEWLFPYAAWCVLRDKFATSNPANWKEYAVYDQERVEALRKANREAFDYYYFLQYHLDRQLRETRDYAHAKGIVLKGDIPIGVGRDSVDAWQKSRLFNMDCQAGAPPDDFSVLGQNWGFPTYNWEEMAADGFMWWRNRFGKMADFFDAYRIDHILGFFRIWQIPIDCIHGLLGYFNPALPFSPEEMRNNYDFWINPDVQCRPLILDWMLGDFFGHHAQEVREKYLDYNGDGRYRLKEEFDSQRKVKAHFDKLEDTEANRHMRDGLLGLIDQVLFVEDPYRPGHYHPRISGQFSYQFRILSDYEKWCFNRLYNNFYYHRHNDFWYGKAMWKLPPLLDSTDMLTCAEDLGMIPDCVPEVMHRLEILSLEIQRMPKDPKVEFGNTWHYPYYSVCTTSTHDMPGIRAWWEDDHDRSQRFFNNVLGEHGGAPYFAEPWLCEKIVKLHLDSPSMLCVLPWQDWVATSGELRREQPAEEQINEPANSEHYWRYRMHLPVERLLREQEFNNRLKIWITESNR
ncbi:MAG: 4-alpha-glucanotransferase [Muribaculaceae bacterium]|nr:4-alpha-glucanotransferase [Muribaculaceae bacterium]